MRLHRSAPNGLVNKFLHPFLHNEGFVGMDATHKVMVRYAKDFNNP